MTESQIVVCNLSKTYRIPEREPGLAASLRSLVRRRYREVKAVRDISFTVEAGEVVGFIGPNGAGKTTTLKMLSGLLYPTAGEARVLGAVPWERKSGYLRRISMVLGNKSQMSWDIPPLDTFCVLGEIYHVPPAELERTVDELVDLLDMQDLWPACSTGRKCSSSTSRRWGWTSPCRVACGASWPSTTVAAA